MIRAVFALLHQLLASLFWVVVSAVLFVGLFQVAAPFSAILFYQGISLAIAAAVLCTLVIYVLPFIVPPLGRILCPGFQARDAITGALLGFAFNITFLIVFPVTIDRSVTVFLLGELSRAGEHGMSEEALTEKLHRRYVDELHAAHRRMSEQIESGMVVEEAGRFRLTPSGEHFMRFSRAISPLFGVNPEVLGREE